MISTQKRISVFAIMATLGVIVAAPAEEGCTKEQGAAIKTGVKDVFNFADALCLSGLVERADLTNAQKIDICGIVEAGKDFADAFLVKEAGIQQARVTKAVAAHAAAACSCPPVLDCSGATKATAGKDAGK